MMDNHTVEIPNQEQVLAHYPEDLQALVQMEECAELAQAISKMRRSDKEELAYNVNRLNLVEEIADVLIVINQLRTAYDIGGIELQTFIDEKCKRQAERIREEEEEKNTAPDPAESRIIETIQQFCDDMERQGIFKKGGDS